MLSEGINFFKKLHNIWLKSLWLSVSQRNYSISTHHLAVENLFKIGWADSFLRKISRLILSWFLKLIEIKPEQRQFLLKTIANIRSSYNVKFIMILHSALYIFFLIAMARRTEKIQRYYVFNNRILFLYHTSSSQVRWF